MMVTGFLNVSRGRNKDGLTRAFSVIGNLLIWCLRRGLHTTGSGCGRKFPGRRNAEPGRSE